MKKLLALILALVILTTLSVSASAVPNVTIAELSATAAEISVKGTFIADPEVDVWNVDIEWGPLSFTYDETTTWNPRNHVYDKAYAWNVTEGTNEVTVTNNSSQPVNVGMTFEGKTTVNDGIAATIEGKLNGLTAIDPTPVDIGGEMIVAVTITGGALSEGATNVDIGTITVALSDPNP